MREQCVAGLELAIARAGGQTALANQVGVKQPHIWNWLHRNGRVPAERVIAVEAATGVPRHELRPDIYPPENQAA